uniref:Uncharacterized protein n=1 Tax=Arion vulgaris TaxID=1028688 RepID=A0A0B6ZNM7_9EUPU
MLRKLEDWHGEGTNKIMKYNVRERELSWEGSWGLIEPTKKKLKLRSENDS